MHIPRPVFLVLCNNMGAWRGSPHPHLSKGSGQGSGDRSSIRFCLKDINTPGRDRTHQASSRNTSLRLQG